ncbi:hypothetical protein CR513_53007, partial [Mucuna pruriens]
MNSLWGLTSLRKPSDFESKIIMGDGVRVLVVDIGVITLCLPFGHTLLLIDVVYVPSIRRNLIYTDVVIILSLVVVNYLLILVVVGSRVLYDGLYVLNVNNVSDNSNVGNVWGIYLCPKLKDLIKKGILHDIVFFDYDTCVDCIKGKSIVKTKNKGGNTYNNVLQLIHTNIYGLITSTTMSVYRQERRLNVRFDTKGDNHYDEIGRNLDPFIKFLDECEIKAQYTMPSTYKKNGVVERHNHTLINMMRCILSHSSLLVSLLGYALRIVVYILNQIPNKFSFTIGNEHLVCRLKKSIYGLKHTSRKWYFKFVEVVTSFGFKENATDKWL